MIFCRDDGIWKMVLLGLLRCNSGHLVCGSGVPECSRCVNGCFWERKRVVVVQLQIIVWPVGQVLAIDTALIITRRVVKM